MSERHGPQVDVVIRYRCDGCEYHSSERYQVQGDSGRNHYCNAPQVLQIHGAPQYYGESGSQTPQWCPFRRDSSFPTPSPHSENGS